MTGGRDEASLGCGLRGEDQFGLHGEHRGYFEELEEGGVIHVHYFAHHKLNFLGIFSSPETDHSHVRYNSTEL